MGYPSYQKISPMFVFSSHLNQTAQWSKSSTIFPSIKTMTMNYRHATGYDDSNLVLRISSLSVSYHGNETKESSKKSRLRHLPGWQVFCRPHEI